MKTVSRFVALLVAATIAAAPAPLLAQNIGERAKKAQAKKLAAKKDAANKPAASKGASKNEPVGRVKKRAAANAEAAKAKGQATPAPQK